MHVSPLPESGHKSETLAEGGNDVMSQYSVTVEKARKILGKAAEVYSDEQIRSILDMLYGISIACYEQYAREENAKKGVKVCSGTKA